MALNAVTFGSTTLVDSSKGDWTLTPGTFARVWGFERLARGRGEIAKDLGSGGAVHTLEVVFHLMTTAQLAALQGTLDGMTAPVGWDGGLATLKATDPAGATMFEARWCALEGVEVGKPERRTTGHNSNEVRWEQAVTFIFRQVRR